MKYKAVVFDLYGTLIDINTDESSDIFWDRFRSYLAEQGADVQPMKLKSIYRELVDKKTKELSGVEYPDIEILDVFSDIFTMLELEVNEKRLNETASVFRRLSRKYIKTYEATFDVLDYLKSKDYRLILLSNAQSAFTIGEIDMFDLGKYFDKIYLSSDYKVSKPDSKYFEIMLDSETLAADECIYIGNDHIADVQGSKSVGMDVIYVHTNLSQNVLDDFECYVKIMDGDLSKVIDYL